MTSCLIGLFPTLITSVYYYRYYNVSYVLIFIIETFLFPPSAPEDSEETLGASYDCRDSCGELIITKTVGFRTSCSLR